MAVAIVCRLSPWLDPPTPRHTVAKYLISATPASRIPLGLHPFYTQDAMSPVCALNATKLAC
eukprot:scaffold195686_cov17-Tisochrysis_lutea.AAC.1